MMDKTKELQNLPIGVQDFEKLRNEGFFYLDKTAIVWKLISTGCYYFLSRPRRFGKSLLLSTIKAFFEGKHDLFIGLKIEEEMITEIGHPIPLCTLTLILKITNRKPHLMRNLTT